MRFHCHAVGVDVAPPQQTTMDFRVQGLDPAIEDLRKTGHLSYIGDFNTGLANGACCTACAEYLYSQVLQPLDEGLEAAFVPDTDEGSLYLDLLTHLLTLDSVQYILS